MTDKEHSQAIHKQLDKVLNAIMEVPNTRKKIIMELEKLLEIIFYGKDCK
jgi:hypothetical protein